MSTKPVPTVVRKGRSAMEPQSEQTRRSEHGRRRGAAAIIAFALVVVFAAALLLAPAGHLLFLILTAAAFGTGCGLLFRPPWQGTLAKDRAAFRVLLGVTVGGVLVIVLLPVLGRTGIW